MARAFHKKMFINNQNIGGKFGDSRITTTKKRSFFWAET